MASALQAPGLLPWVGAGGGRLGTTRPSGRSQSWILGPGFLNLGAWAPPLLSGPDPCPGWGSKACVTHHLGSNGPAGMIPAAAWPRLLGPRGL